MRILNTEKLKQNIESRVCADIESGMVGGAAVKVMQDGHVLLRENFGYADCDTRMPLKDNSIFRLASMTKPITAAAVLIQMSRGKLDLFDPVDRFLPEYRHMFLGSLDGEGNVIRTREATNRVRVIHLLTHSSGIGTDMLGDVQWNRMSASDRQSIASSVDYFSRSAIAFEPYTAQLYSPVAGFDVLARIVELTSGMEYKDFVAREIFEPLGMSDTTCVPTEEQWGRVVSMHNYIDGKGVSANVGERFIFGDLPLTYNCGGAGVASTIDDYSKFASMLLDGGSFEGRQIIPSELVRAMGIPHLPETVMPCHEIWGLGVRVIVNPAYVLPVGSYGWSGAYGTHFWVDPQNRIVALYMKNSHFEGGAGCRTANNFEVDVMSALEM